MKKFGRALNPVEIADEEALLCGVVAASTELDEPPSKALEVTELEKPVGRALERANIG
jgi:hypothetical protein